MIKSCYDEVDHRLSDPRDLTILSIARYKDSVRPSKTLSDFTKEALLYNAGLKYKFQQKIEFIQTKNETFEIFHSGYLDLGIRRRSRTTRSCAEKLSN